VVWERGEREFKPLKKRNAIAEFHTVKGGKGKREERETSVLTTLSLITLHQKEKGKEKKVKVTLVGKRGGKKKNYKSNDAE